MHYGIMVNPDVCDNEIGFHYLQPIPLTPEILEKNNLILGDNIISSDKTPFGEIFNSINIKNTLIENGQLQKEAYQIYIRNKELSIFEGRYICIRIAYVHELQHALRLCGLNELADNFKPSIKNNHL